MIDTYLETLAEAGTDSLGLAAAARAYEDRERAAYATAELALEAEALARLGPPLDVPPVLEDVFEREDAALVVSISGGKDSQAMLAAVARAHRERGWRCGLFAIHADLGRPEWAESLPHCQKLCDDLGIFLKVVRRPQGDLLQEIQERMAKLAARADAQDERSAHNEAWEAQQRRIVEYARASQARHLGWYREAVENGEQELARRRFRQYEASVRLEQNPRWEDITFAYRIIGPKVEPPSLPIGGASNPWPTASMRYCTADQKRGQLQKAKRTAGWPDAQNRYCTSDQKRTQIDKAMRSPGWPSADARYCTAHHKTNQVNTALREYRLVVSAMGMRAQESKARAKKIAFQIDADLTGKILRERSPEDALARWSHMDTHYPPTQRPRLAFEWLPIFDWTVDDVWAACGTSAADLARRQTLYKIGLREQALDGWPAHPAYVYGNERVSCSLCILASRNDLEVGARHNPELYRTYVQMERESGFTFQHKKPLSDIAPDLLEAAS